MPGIPTEHLAERIEETNRRLADEVHALGDRIDQAERRMGERISHVERRLDDVRVEVAAEFGKARAEMATELGRINATLESIRTRVDGGLSISRWTVGVLVPVVISLIGGGFWLTWHAAKLDSRVEQVERKVEKAASIGPAKATEARR